jgi:hypothetical protein
MLELSGASDRLAIALLVVSVKINLLTKIWRLEQNICKWVWKQYKTWIDLQTNEWEDLSD